MEAKEYLNRVKKADAIIESKRKKYDRLQEKRYKITQTMKEDIVSGGGSRGGFSDASDELIDLEKELVGATKRYDQLVVEAETLLEKLENQNHYDVLSDYYIMHKSFEQIAVDMGYTYRNVCYLHGRALQAFQRVLDEREA